MPAQRPSPDVALAVTAERRCVATGESRPRAELLRFVVGPDARLVPDIGNELPGRGLWLTPTAEALAQAVRRKAFQRAARAAITVPDELGAQVERLLARRCLDLLGLARRAGQLVTGFEKVQEMLRRDPVAALVAASDGGDDGRRKLRRLAPDAPLVALFDRAELSLAIGRENVVHAALKPGGLARKFLMEAARLSGFRAAPVADDAVGVDAK